MKKIKKKGIAQYPDTELKRLLQLPSTSGKDKQKIQNYLDSGK